MLTVGSLFSGIGGLDLGLERAGMRVVWQVEIDEWCRKMLAKHWPDVERFGDIKTCGIHNLKPVDLICGGFPCQPVSSAGKRKGDADERWLWPGFARIVCDLEPRWVLAENVPGLLAIDTGRLFGTILRDLAALGYDAEWELLPACAFGAPHIRYRLFIVAHANGPRLAEWKSIFRDDGTQRQAVERSNWWAVEPDVGRVANGVPARVNRLRGLGNAVVPQVAEWIGKRIVKAVSACMVLCLVAGCVTGKVTPTGAPGQTHDPSPAPQPIATTGTGASVAVGEARGLSIETAVPLGLMPLMAIVIYLSHRREILRIKQNGKVK